MATQRLYHFSEHIQPSRDEPIRSVIAASDDAVVVAWHVKPGQQIAPHVHPRGQDTWTILMGRGEYQLDADGETIEILQGDVVVAHRGEVHGVYNDGDEPLIFISVVAPGDAGFEPL
jgi:quercetin dioxygenase-like cupin family protein